MFLNQRPVSPQIPKALFVKFTKVCRLKDRHVDITLFKKVLHQIGFAVFLELFPWPIILFGADLVVVIKAIDKFFPVPVALVSRTRIPQRHMTVDDKKFLSAFCSKHNICLSIFYSPRLWDQHGASLNLTML